MVNHDTDVNKIADVITHGLTILEDNFLPAPPGAIQIAEYVGIKHRCTSISLGDVDIADWDEWHLVLEGEKYYSKFKNYEEWEEFYSEK
tara:strand:+ start:60 stop:326 length:267 start_codon:yes stop_codon:yes gene_type:complete